MQPDFPAFACRVDRDDRKLGPWPTYICELRMYGKGLLKTSLVYVRLKAVHARPMKTIPANRALKFSK
jgi:hypothetical protein